MNKEDEELIRTNYFDKSHPTYFASANKVFEFYERKFPLDQVTEVLSKYDSYSLHKEFRKGQRNISYSNFKRYRFECDLVDVRHLAKYNDGVNYLFTCIDTFTRYAFVRLMESKHASCAVRAFQSILEEAEVPPITLAMDRGTEFTNQDFQTFCDSKGIKYYPPDSYGHCAYIERFNRTLQGIIYRHLTMFETNRFITHNDGEHEFHMMPFFLTNYNNSHHRMIGTTPAIAENDDSTHLGIIKNMSEYRSKVKKAKIKFNIGDLVRLKKIEGKFNRGYDHQATREYFRVHAIKQNMPIPMYILSNFSGDEILKGSFYANELVKIDSEDRVDKIEKVLKKQTVNGVKQIFVKWLGWPDKYNQWINESEVTQVF